MEVVFVLRDVPVIELHGAVVPSSRLRADMQGVSDFALRIRRIRRRLQQKCRPRRME